MAFLSSTWVDFLSQSVHHIFLVRAAPSSATVEIQQKCVIREMVAVRQDVLQDGLAAVVREVSLMCVCVCVHAYAVHV